MFDHRRIVFGTFKASNHRVDDLIQTAEHLGSITLGHKSVKAMREKASRTAKPSEVRKGRSPYLVVHAAVADDAKGDQACLLDPARRVRAMGW